MFPLEGCEPIQQHVVFCDCCAPWEHVVNVHVAVGALLWEVCPWDRAIQQPRFMVSLRFFSVGWSTLTVLRFSSNQLPVMPAPHALDSSLLINRKVRGGPECKTCYSVSTWHCLAIILPQQENTCTRNPEPCWEDYPELLPHPSGTCLSFLFLICHAVSYEASNCESEHGMSAFSFLHLLQQMQVILDDDSFAGETMNCMNQMFSQRLKTIAW